MNNQALFKTFSLLITILLFIGCNRNNSSVKSGKNISQALAGKLIRKMVDLNITISLKDNLLAQV